MIIENMKIYEIIQGDFIKFLGLVEIPMFKGCEKQMRQTGRNKKQKNWKEKEDMETEGGASLRRLV